MTGKTQASETQMIANSQIGNLGYNFLIVAVTHYHCQAHAHAFFWVSTHSLFYRLGIVGTGVCARFRMGKDKVSDIGEGGDCSGKVENGM